MKSKINMLAGCIIILSILFVTSCTYRMIDFTVISSKNVDLSRIHQFTKGSQRVAGEDTVYIILFVPTGTANAKEAVDKAIEKVPGAVALVDGVVYHNWWYIVYFFGMEQYVVEGTPLIDKSLIESQNEMPSKYIIFYDAKGVQRMVYLTKNEYYSIKSAISKNDVSKVETLLLK